MMNFFDIFVIIATAGLAALGFREGLVRGAIKLLGFIVIVLLSSVFSHTIIDAGALIPAVPKEIAVPLAFLIVMIVGMAAVHFIAALLYRLIHLTPAGFVDSGLGCALGILKSIILCGLMALILSLTPANSFFRDQYNSSKSARPLASMVTEIVPFVKNSLIPYYQRFTPSQKEPEQNPDAESSTSNII